MKSIVRYLPTILVAAVIAYVSLRRDFSFAESLHWWHFEGSDKVVHIIMYGVLALVLGLALYKEKLKLFWQHTLTISVSALYGGLMEILQGTFFAPRTADWWDWLADIVGAVLAVIVLRFLNAQHNQ